MWGKFVVYNIFFLIPTSLCKMDVEWYIWDGCRYKRVDQRTENKNTKILLVGRNVENIFKKAYEFTWLTLLNE